MTTNKNRPIEQLEEWIWHLGGNEIWNDCEERYATKEGAIQAGLEAKPAYYGDEETLLEVGRVVASGLSPDAESLVDQMSDVLWDEVGEPADSWEPTSEEIALLQTMLEETVNKWANETKNQPCCYSIEEIETIG